MITCRHYFVLRRLMHPAMRGHVDQDANQKCFVFVGDSGNLHMCKESLNELIVIRQVFPTYQLSANTHA